MIAVWGGDGAGTPAAPGPPARRRQRPAQERQGFGDVARAAGWLLTSKESSGLASSRCVRFEGFVIARAIEGMITPQSPQVRRVNA